MMKTMRAHVADRPCRRGRVLRQLVRVDQDGGSDPAHHAVGRPGRDDEHSPGSASPDQFEGGSAGAPGVDITPKVERTMSKASVENGSGNGLPHHEPRPVGQFRPRARLGDPQQDGLHIQSDDLAPGVRHNERRRSGPGGHVEHAVRLCPLPRPRWHVKGVVSGALYRGVQVKGRSRRWTSS